jgi:Fe-S-cluster containining protein
MLSLEEAFREKLLEIYRHAPLDAPSFHRFYTACGPGECAAMCCNGGSGFYMDEEPETIRRVVSEHRAFFDEQKLNLPEQLFDEEVNDKTGEIELSTNTRDFTYPAGAKPDHFPATACIFRREDGACTLQVLSLKEGNPGWWYKPFACWLFPIELEQRGKPCIHVAHASTDEYVDDKYPGFVGFVKCGKECKSTGAPAHKVLAREIAQLSQLLERDLMSEILAYKEEAA